MAEARQPELNLADILGDGGTYSDSTAHRAAAVVEDYVRDQAITALDSMLVAAESETQGDGEVAAAIAAASRIVDGEVARFHALSRRGDARMS